MQVKTENDMADAVLKHFNRGKCVACREVKLGRNRFDVVAYDKNQQLFSVIECKLHSKPTTVGRTFGQAMTYLTNIENHAFEFLDAASRKLQPLRFRRWWEATHGWTEINVAFYVALTDKACRQPEFNNLRRMFPSVGIIRVKPNGRCRHALRRPDGTADSKAARARRYKFTLRDPAN